MKNNNEIINRSFIFIILITFLCTCTNKKNTINASTGQIETEINDSLSIFISYNENNTINTIVITNKLSGVNSIYSFRNDGITPVLVGQEINGKRDGIYLTYYSSGRLNNKVNYIKGEFDGDYESFSENGETIYKAYYEKGIEKNIEIKDTTLYIDIVEIEN